MLNLSPGPDVCQASLPASLYFARAGHSMTSGAGVERERWGSHAHRLRCHPEGDAVAHAFAVKVHIGLGGDVAPSISVGSWRGAGTDGQTAQFWAGPSPLLPLARCDHEKPAPGALATGSSK